jgi:GNAT superfamily N-acetyltransferase
VALEVREARGSEEVEAAGRVTVAAYAEFAPPDPAHPVWSGYVRSQGDAAARARDGTLLVAVDGGRVVGTVTLYLERAPGSDQWRDGDASFRLLAVAPSARGRGVGRALFEACLRRARAAGKPRMALHTVPQMTIARAMYERAGFVREPEGDVDLGPFTILAYAAPL